MVGRPTKLVHRLGLKSTSMLIYFDKSLLFVDELYGSNQMHLPIFQRFPSADLKMFVHSRHCVETAQPKSSAIFFIRFMMGMS